MDRLRLAAVLAVPLAALGALGSLACANDPPVALPPVADASAGAPDAPAAVAPDAAEPAADAAVAADDASEVADDAGGATEPTWCGQVRPIVQAKCQLCHGATPAFGAPIALVSYSDVRVRNMVGIPIHERMATRVTAPQSRMPPPNQPQLTEAEVRTVVRWSMAGAPEGDCSVTPDAGPAADAEVGPGDAGLPANTYSMEFRAHAQGAPGTPYSLPVDATNYRCWAFTIPPGGAPQQYVVRFEHLIDNTQHLHHTLFFRNRQADSPEGPFSCGSPELTWDMVSGWAPGQPDESMPAGVGVRAFPGDQFVLQAHYDQVRAMGQTDQSGIRLIMTDQPGLQESAVLWAGGAWSPDLNGVDRRGGQCTVNTPFTMFSVFPHMHKLGTRITLELQRQGTNTWEMVAEVPAWSFDDQPKLSIPMPYQVLARGDKLRTRCWWDTLGRSVGFGEASDDEMCFNFINHYPALSNPTLACLMFLQPF